MGLLYQMPTSIDEGDRSSLINGTLFLRSYGLPYIFWGYLLASLTTLLIMFFAIRPSLHKLASYPDQINQTIVYGVYFLFLFLPIFAISFFFYEKIIIKEKSKITLVHKLFYIPILSKTIQLTDAKSFQIVDMDGTPNIARMKGSTELQGYQNRGYFQLMAEELNGKKILIDRNSRNLELKKLVELLAQY